MTVGKEKRLAGPQELNRRIKAIMKNDELSNSEKADGLELIRDEILLMYSIKDNVTISDNGEELSLFDTIAAKEPDLDERLKLEEFQKGIVEFFRKKFVKERVINIFIAHYQNFESDLVDTLEVTGKQFKITRERVRQLIAKLIGMILRNYDWFEENYYIPYALQRTLDKERFRNKKSKEDREKMYG
jgi:DNA-directed RNA polymerase sigma subunit (sigma70/sigma32)